MTRNTGSEDGKIHGSASSSDLEAEKPNQVKRGEFLSLLEVERFLQHKPAELRDIVLELRNLVASAAPYAHERILWKGLSYYDRERGGPVRAGICQIEIHADHVRLSFIHGAFLEDPDNLLEGNRKAKRYVRLEGFADAPWENLAQLIRTSAALDPASLCQ